MYHIIRTRYAPSPTGYLHAGQIRSALFNYLFAKQNAGVFVVRSEDTDKERSKGEFENGIFKDLAWLGIEPDESPVHGGPYGPYRQSERAGLYAKHLARLFDRGLAFYCFHSERATTLEYTSHIPHRCDHKNIALEEQKVRAHNEQSVIRFNTLSTADKTVSFEDAVRGKLDVEAGLIEDFSIAKGDGSPLYNFAVVVDDFEMAVTHVIRGEDHISNTFKQILLYDGLTIKKPEVFAHLPLVLGTDRSKLSKRSGAKAIHEYHKEGYLAEALLNFIALLGWNPGGEQEIFSKKELIERFSLEKIQKSGAMFDTAKLDWMNSVYIRALSPDELLRRAADFLPPEARENAPKARRALALEQPRLKRLAEISEHVGFYFSTPNSSRELLRWKTMTDAEVDAALAQVEVLLNSEGDIVSAWNKIIEAAGAAGDKGKLLWPLRAALSGKKASPGPQDIIAVIGKEEALRRIGYARKLLAARE